MADSTPDLRKDVLAWRLNGSSNNIVWTAKGLAQVTGHVDGLSKNELLRVVERKLLSSQAPGTSAQPAPILPAIDANAFSVECEISNESPDHMNDVIKQKTWNLTPFGKNGAVLLNHNSSTLPVAQASLPWLRSSSTLALMAIATFPAAGTSALSDQTRAMVMARVVRGCSVGFIPGDFSFTSDPSRPGGINFEKGHTLTEFSFCSVPANPLCLVVGPVSNAKSASRVRNVPLDDYPLPAEQQSDWECKGIHTMPIDATDDPFDQAKAKAALLERCSPDGTILDGARDYFFAVKPSAPFEASSYEFPFCRVGGGTVVASKVGWRQSFAALEKSDMPGTVISEARAVVDALEGRLGEIKMAQRRREAEAIVGKAHTLIGSIPDPVPQTREQRVAEARRFRLAAYRA